MTEAAVEATTANSSQLAPTSGWRFYLGPYSTGKFWQGLLKSLIEVGLRELLLATAKAFASAFVGTVTWYVKKEDPVAEVSTPDPTSESTSSKVFTREYAPAREYSSSRSYAPPGFGSSNSDVPFGGFGR